MVTIPAWVRGPKWTNIAFIVRPWATLRMAVLHFQLKRVPASYAIAVITLLATSKRRRPIPVDSSYGTSVTGLSRPVETLSSTTPPTFFRTSTT
ncbi:hypothetical protein CU097_009062 [Rhizopus azygosporus]|uniref:Uncharacterized protein n=2 Tax=Rhizopus TaxID=4842 RepID=A0A367K8A7_RHIAZ|nr:hypothetical protein BCV71DRAFT_267858 [Rhizopus microsporus]RCH98418.1 hypothetical protein CU097_009062 [Rhizopus azygosporus]